MTDLHKALTEACNRANARYMGRWASSAFVAASPYAYVRVPDLRALLAKYPPTAPHPREPMLGGPDGADQAAMMERGRRLASERDDLIAAGADPAELVVPLAPPTAPVVDRDALVDVLRPLIGAHADVTANHLIASGVLQDAATVERQHETLTELCRRELALALATVRAERDALREQLLQVRALAASPVYIDTGDDLHIVVERDDLRAILDGGEGDG